MLAYPLKGEEIVFEHPLLPMMSSQAHTVINVYLLQPTAQGPALSNIAVRPWLSFTVRIIVELREIFNAEDVHDKKGKVKQRQRTIF